MSCLMNFERACGLFALGYVSFLSLTLNKNSPPSFKVLENFGDGQLFARCISVSRGAQEVCKRLLRSKVYGRCLWCKRICREIDIWKHYNKEMQKQRNMIRGDRNHIVYKGSILPLMVDDSVHG